MSTPNAVGAAIADIHARTGWTWAEVADHLGTTPTYARKLASGAGKFGSEKAGASLASNLADYGRTGAAQTPHQRIQAVRAAGGGTVPAAPRTAPSSKAAPMVTRSVFKGSTRDGWAVQVNVPKRKSAAGDREDARNAITAAVRRAAQGRRRVGFRVTIADPSDPSGRRVVDVGTAWGFNAKNALAGIRDEGRDPLAWLMQQDLGKYWWVQLHPDEGDGEFEDDEDEEGSGILAVEVIGLP